MFSFTTIAAFIAGLVALFFAGGAKAKRDGIKQERARNELKTAQEKNTLSVEESKIETSVKKLDDTEVFEALKKRASK
jgi:cell division protein FtsB